MPALAQGQKNLFTHGTLEAEFRGTFAEPFTRDFLILGIVVTHGQVLPEILFSIRETKLDAGLNHGKTSRLRGFICVT